MAMRKRFGVLSMLLFAFMGLADAAYLAQHVASGLPIICTVAGLSDCNTVAQSPYSRILGIPIAYVGVFYYGILFMLAALELVLIDLFLRRVLQGAALVGVVASLGFVLLQGLIIKAFCIYCLLSAVLAALSFIAATMIEPLPNVRTLVAKRAQTKVSQSLPMPPLP